MSSRVQDVYVCDIDRDYSTSSRDRYRKRTSTCAAERSTGQSDKPFYTASC